MSIDFTPGIINTYHGDIYNCTQIPIMLKRQTHRSGLVIIGKNNNPLIPYSLEKDTTLNNLI
ncbi:yhiS [Escherichia coli]|uniref:YhiS n=1 Tax=Escherichia coli TaxID=562 RepID=A0A376TXE0_ECOLX|nr:yhiS [Escherichia coli]